VEAENPVQQAANLPALRTQIYRKTLRHFFKPVDDLLFKDGAITEVLINGPSTIYYEKKGKLHLAPECKFENAEVLMAAVRNLAEYVNRRIDNVHLSMDARLPEPERFRVHVLIPPASRQGVCVSIRKFTRRELAGKSDDKRECPGCAVCKPAPPEQNQEPEYGTLPWYVEQGALSAEAREYLELMVEAQRNIIVSGGTSSGKTTLLNALSEAIPEQERIIVIEDSSELELRKPHTLYLEACPPQPDGKGGKTIRELFVDSLRMRPDRIVVGEVRRGEALDMIQSMLSGHDGALSTVHASAPRMALVRLETLCLMSDAKLPVYVARMQVGSAMHVVVQVQRFGDGQRRVRVISEVLGLRTAGQEQQYRLRDIFRFEQTGYDGERMRGELKRVLAPGKASRFAQDVRDLIINPREKIRHTATLWEPSN